MNLIKDHVDYLKDNPEGYWFKRKLYGYGWTPAKPAGWITLGVYLISLLGAVWYAQASGMAESNEPPTRLIAFIVGATTLLLIIAWRTGEPLKWQWGKDHQSKKESGV
jgi:hypothetical protein